MGSSSHWGLIMAPIQEANSDNLGKSFRFSAEYLQHDYMGHDCFHLERFNGLVYMYIFSDLILLVALHPK